MHLPQEDAICFGPMRLYRAARLLFNGDSRVRLGGRAMDLLIALVDQAPNVVTKAELDSLVWPKVEVEESSLRVQVASLRKSLVEHGGDPGVVVSVPGRGYAFVGALEVSTNAPPDGPAVVPRLALTRSLPVRLTPMIGREAAMDTVVAMLSEHRMVTIIGSGGIGKTTLAIAVAEKVVSSTQRAAVFVDLSVISEGDRVAAAIGSALGMTISADRAHEVLTEQIRDRSDLMILDNCEHIVDKVAALAENLLRAAPELRILATSREALRIVGEKAFRLETLPTPPVESNLSAKEAITFPSVALLIDRANSDNAGFEFKDTDAALAGELCRRLDGLPLAIEMAAARIGVLGLRDLVANLKNRFSLLSGNRTSLPRHQTLETLYEWSYVQLSEEAKAALNSLSVLSGTFTLATAAQVIGVEDTAENANSIAETIIDLTAKSLVIPSFDRDTVRYRLLATCRHFAREKLQLSPDRRAIHSRHAQYLIDQLTRANEAWNGSDRIPWTDAYAPLFDDVLYALDWAASDEGDGVLGAELALAALHLEHQLSAHEIYLHRLQRVIAKFSSVALAHPLLDMRLHIALGVASALCGAQLKEMESIHERAVLAAQRLNDPRFDTETPYGMWLGYFMHGEFPRALLMAQQIESAAVAIQDDSSALVGRRMLAQTNHYLGNHASAREYAMAVLKNDRRVARLGGYWIDPGDRQISIRIILARDCWIRGKADKALEIVKECLSLSSGSMHNLESQVLATAACPIACWTGDLDAARDFLTELLKVTFKNDIRFWGRWGQALSTVLSSGTVHTSRPAESQLTDMLCTIAPRHVDAAAVARVKSGVVGWCGPEVLRAWGERLLQDGNILEAKTFYLDSIAQARQQGALAWELRSTTSLARVLHENQQTSAARGMMTKVLAQFTEGFGTADYKAAKTLLNQLS